MRSRLSLPTGFLLLPIYIGLVQAISLADFKGRLTNLPSACNTAYTATIAGCVASDFLTGICTSACVQGLVEIGNQVRTKCAGVDTGDLSIITIFASGVGPQTACKNVQVASTLSPSSSKTSTTSAIQASKPSTSSSIAQTTRTSTSSTQAAISTSSDAPFTLQTTTTAESSTTQLLVDPSSTASSVTSNLLNLSPTTSRSTPPPRPTFVIQKSNPDSGGGSPFDIQAGPPNAASQLTVSLAFPLLGSLLFLLLQTW